MPERMSVLETKVERIEGDVTEIKRDVKTLLANNASGMGALGLMQRAAPWFAFILAALVAASELSEKIKP